MESMTLLSHLSVKKSTQLLITTGDKSHCHYLAQAPQRRLAWLSCTYTPSRRVRRSRREQRAHPEGQGVVQHLHQATLTRAFIRYQCWTASQNRHIRRPILSHQERCQQLDATFPRLTSSSHAPV